MSGIKSIQSEEQFHRFVADLERISQIKEVNITSKLKETKGKLDGRFVTFIKKVLSLIPKVNLSTTNLDTVVKKIAQLAVDYEKKGYFTTVDQAKLIAVIENLKNKGKLYTEVSGQRMGSEKVFYCAFKTINELSAKKFIPPRQPRSKEDNNTILRKELEKRGLMTPLLEAVWEGNKDKVLELISQGFDPSIPDSTGCLPLHHALRVENLSIPILEILVQNPANVNYRSNEGEYPLSIALRLGYIATAKFLLEKGASPDSRDSLGFLPIHYAAREGDIEMVKALIPFVANINDAQRPPVGSEFYFPEHAFTPLCLAAMSRNADLVKLLLEMGADPNSATTAGRLPLHSAVQQRYYGIDEKKDEAVKEIIKLLIPLTNDLNKQGHLGRTPLADAAISSNTIGLNLLIEKGGKADIRDEIGMLPLHHAAYYGDVEIAKILIPLTPDINDNQTTGEMNEQLTPLLVALKNKQSEVAKLLLEKGANPNLPDKDGNLPLHYAVKNNDLELSRSLAAVTQDLNKVGAYAESHLLMAAKQGNHALVKVLLAKGADADMADKQGNLPLHRALRGNNVELVADLIAATKNLNKSGSINETPLLIAIKEGSPTFLEMLLKGGAKLSPADKSVMESYLILETKAITKLLKEYGQI
ncbi:MAG: hypothetical protein CK425_12140 [Parachlamydia sp.]|nr:MAG: hypothetical protein CK425_12140 [Parachlamydia sp.]